MDALIFFPKWEWSPCLNMHFQTADRVSKDNRTWPVLEFFATINTCIRRMNCGECAKMRRIRPVFAA